MRRRNDSVFSIKHFKYSFGCAMGMLNFNPEPPKAKRSRSRNITWFNPPYSANVATNIGHKFLQLIDECFPKDHPLHKIFNRNTLKVSYSCMPNMKNIISSHNNLVLNKEAQSKPSEATECNCRQKDSCPLSGKCQTKGLVYQATVTRKDNTKQETYVGLTENTFKTRYSNHISSFRNPTQICYRAEQTYLEFKRIRHPILNQM